MDFQLVPNFSICSQSHGNHHSAAGGGDGDDDGGEYDGDKGRLFVQANNLCDLGIERETLLELCKNFQQIPQVLVMISDGYRE